MAKQLQTLNTRLVFTGTDAEPTAMKAEYGVEDGDLVARGKRAVLEGTNFNTAMSGLWNATMATLRSNENIT